MWLSRRDETDDAELGSRAAKALRHENDGPAAQTIAAIFGRSQLATWARTGLGGRTQRELGKTGDK